MGRPPTPIGAHGIITTKPVTLADGREVHEARCRFRAADGSLIRMKRRRKTGPAAEAALKKAVVAAVNEVRGGEISKDTKLRAVAEKWYRTFELEVAAGTRAPTSASNYRGQLDNHILPALGELTMREFITTRIEAFLTAKREAGTKPDALKLIKAVLNNITKFAKRHGALDENPMRDTSEVRRGEKRAVKSLDGEQRADLFAHLDADQLAREADVPDILRTGLSTGSRISEILGCAKEDFYLDPKTKKPKLRVGHRVTRVTGKGVVRRARTGGSKGEEQVLGLPGWIVPLLTTRALAAKPGGPLFPDRWGGWRAPGEVSRQLRDALDRAGYDWVTSHVMRKTVARVLKEAGLSVREIAEQLGQATTRVTEEHYLDRDATNDKQVEALERMMESGT